MSAWTDMDALCAAIRRTKNRGEAAALIATWRVPVRAKQLPLRAPAAGTPSGAPLLSRDEQVRLARGAIRAIEEASDKAGSQ